MNQKHTQPKQRTVALAALKQGMALIKKGLEVHGLKADGSMELISRSKTKDQVWQDALDALTVRQGPKTGIGTAAKLDTTTLNVYTDGGSRGNPGPSASGYVIFTDDESHVLERGGEYLGITTNNQAEYQAVKLGLEAALKFSAQKLNFRIDSLLVVNQLNGVFKVKSQELWPVHQAIKDLIGQFAAVEFKHVKREFNKLADDEVNKILDAQHDSADA